MKEQTDLEALELQTLYYQIKLRRALLQAAYELLPEAIRQARPGRRSRGRNPKTTLRGSPALLRLITRLATRQFKEQLPEELRSSTKPQNGQPKPIDILSEAPPIPTKRKSP